MTRFAAAICALFSLTAALPGVAADDREFDYRVATVVVYNANLPDSKDVARAYMKARGIPDDHAVGLPCSASEVITRDVFEKEIEKPLRAAFTGQGWWETGAIKGQGNLAVKTTVRAIVLIHGMPLTISEKARPADAPVSKLAPPFRVNASSVDAEITMLGVLDRESEGPMSNPYYKKDVPFWKSGLVPMFLTGRIDGPDKATALRMIEDTMAAEKEGLYGHAYIDLAQKNAEGYKIGEQWLTTAAASLEVKGIPVVMDTWVPTLPLNYPMEHCAFYLGWYTEVADGPFLNPAFRFQRGAVACHIHSFSATTLRSPTRYWCGPLLNKGACAVLGNVLEPYLTLCANLDIFTDRLLAGYNLGESALASLQGLSWMHVTLGDPLYRPFAAKPDGDKSRNAGYKALRLTAEKWDPLTRDAEFTLNVKRAGEVLKSPEIYEYMALHSQNGGGKTHDKAAPWLELAAKAWKTPADRIRILLLKADALRRDGEKKSAIRVLTGITELYPTEPATAAAKAWLEQLRAEK